MYHARLNPPANTTRDPDGETRLSDAELVRRAAAGSRDAIATIWSRYRFLVRSVVVSTLGPDQDTDDLVQEVFIGLLRGVDQVRDGTALPALLSRIAIRRVGMTLRKRRIRSLTTLLPRTHFPDIAVMAPDLDDRLALSALYRILDRVRERPRLGFLLHHVQGMNVAEVADTLGLSHATTKRAIAAGRKHVLELARSETQLLRFLPKRGVVKE